MNKLYVILLLSISLQGWGQAGARSAAPAPSAAESAETELADLPAYRLDFHEKKPQISDAPATPLIALPIRCADDGALFFNTLNMPGPNDLGADPLKQTIYSASIKGSHSYPTQMLTDLSNVRFIAMDADDSKVALLVSATRKTQSGNSLSSSAQNIVSSQGSFIALFDRDGSYKKSLEIEGKYGLNDLLILPSGEFVVFGYDSVGGTVRVSLLGSDGVLIRPINLSDAMLSDPALRQAESGSSFDRSIALSHSTLGAWRFARARHRAILYEPGSSSPLLEIGPGGATREVPISAPKGFTLDAILPSDDRLLARYRQISPSRSGAGELGETKNNLEFFELNPADGSLRYRIDLGKDLTFNPYSIACEVDGTFLAYRMNKDSKFELLEADVSR